MKRAFLFILIGAALGGGGVWLAQHKEADETEAKKPAADEGDKPSVSRDADGNAVVTMSDELQGDAGIVVANPEAAQIAPELKGYGRVLDPAPLAALLNELTSARAATSVSSNELVRLRMLAEQGNASPRAVQTAEAAALRDGLAIQSAQERLASSWGKAVMEQKDLPGFVQALLAQETVLVRVDLSAGEHLPALPIGARVETLSGNSVAADFLGAATGVDPLTQGRGFVFLAKPGATSLTAGEAVVGYLKLPGEPLAGAIIPRAAVVRTEGKGWAYVLSETGGAFTRREIALDHSTETGWLVTNGITAGQHVVVTGAQMLLSVELKPAESAAPVD